MSDRRSSIFVYLVLLASAIGLAIRAEATADAAAGAAAAAPASPPGSAAAPEAGPLNAPQVPAAPTRDAAGDGVRFEAFPQAWLVDGLADVSLYSFYLGAPSVRGVAYLPNFSPRLGAKAFWKKTGLAVLAPLPAQETDRRGNSDQLSFLLSPYFRDFALDFYYQYYRGFYEDSPWTELSPNRPSRYPQLPDCVVSNFGANAYFSLDSRRYSMRAAFNQLERQTASGGALIVAPFANRLAISPGGRFIPGTAPDAAQTGPNISQGRFTTVGAGFGFGAIFVRRRYFVALQATAGPGAQHQQIDRNDGGLDERMALALKLNGNASIGFNGDEWVAGVKALIDSLSARVGEQQFASSLASAQFFVGARF